MQKGIASARYVDHIGITVPDLNAAVQFFENALGALLLWKVGPFHETPTGVPIKNINIAMLRLGPNINVELMAFEADGQRQTMPSNIDYGATHIGFFVDDLEAAAASLKEHGAELLTGPIEARERRRKVSVSGTSRRPGEPLWKFSGALTTFLMNASRRTAFFSRKSQPGLCES